MRLDTLLLQFTYCGCSSMARVPAFQAGYAGSIPVTRSLYFSGGEPVVS